MTGTGCRIQSTISFLGPLLLLLLDAFAIGLLEYYFGSNQESCTSENWKENSKAIPWNQLELKLERKARRRNFRYERLKESRKEQQGTTEWKREESSRGRTASFLLIFPCPGLFSSFLLVGRNITFSLPLSFLPLSLVYTVVRMMIVDLSHNHT